MINHYSLITFQPLSIFSVDVVYNGFVTVNIPFETELSNHSSLEYKNFSSEMRYWLEDQFCNGTWYQDCSLKIRGFREGSVITEFSVDVKIKSTIDESEVLDYLESKMSSISTKEMLIFNSSSINVEAGNFSKAGIFINNALHCTLNYHSCA